VNTTAGWCPTPSHARAVLGAAGFAVVAVLARRPDVLVLATPLVGAAIWAVILRPGHVPEVSQFVGNSVMREGEATTWHIWVTDEQHRTEDVAALFHAPAWVDLHPSDGQGVVSLPDDGVEPLSLVVRPTRWGRHRLQPALVIASSGWNAFRYVSRDWSDARDLITLPQPSAFDAVAPGVRAPGLVGVNRSPRYGEGSEFAAVRPFQPGDKLRRIHWPESLRSQVLHVTSTWADHDRHVVLLLDAFEDVGESGGIDGRASSLDIAVRATAAIAEHYTRTGDRVALVPIGARDSRRLPPAVGYHHLRRLLEALTNLEPARAYPDRGAMPRGLSSGALVVMLSPLLSEGAFQRLAAIADHGLNVIAIDCLPTDIGVEDPADPYAGITWRIEILERQRRLRQVRQAGVAVVPWRGPGSLDLVLRGLNRRANVRPGRL
jgi:uncharacterized protein (DUF58 family)